MPIQISYAYRIFAGYDSIIQKHSHNPMTDPWAIYGVPWIPSTKKPFMLALISQHQPDPSWESNPKKFRPGDPNCQKTT
jgi:hypothetical protein